MYNEDLPEFTFESATQSEEELSEAVKKLGFDLEEEPAAVEEAASEEPAPPAATETAAAEEIEEQEEDVEPEAAPEPQPKKPSTEHGKSRAAKTREQLRETRAQLARMQAEFEELKKQQGARPGTPPAAEAPKPAVETPKPAATVPATKPKPVYDETKYESYDQFQEELVDWKIEERERLTAEKKRQDEEAIERTKREQAESEAKTRVKADEDAQVTRWKSNVAAAEVRFPDWRDVMTKDRTERPHEALVAAVQLRDDVNTAELAYFLAKYPEKEKALNEVAKTLRPDSPPSQIGQVMRKLDRMLDPFVAELENYEPEDEAEAEQAEPAPAPARTSPPAQSETAAKRPPQQPPPGQSRPAAEAKPKPAVPTPLGSRGATRGMSAWERAQKGEQVDPDVLRKEWEKKNPSLALR